MGSRRKSSINAPKDQTRAAIERMEAEREARRQAMLDRKIERAESEKRNIAAGNPGDVDFIGLVQKWREEHGRKARSHDTRSGEHPKICICVRKRPLNDKERARKDHDSVTVLHPTVWIHAAKFRVDGISKYLDHSAFRFDHSFDELSRTEDIYKHCAMPLVDMVCEGRGCRATVFAYGQTGSGKTFTMNGIQSMVAEDVFLLLSNDDDEGDAHGSKERPSLRNTSVSVSFFELYGGQVQDLLNARRRLKILEDGKGDVVVSGLEEYEAGDAEEFLSLIDTGNKKRTTHATEANDVSSRSHAVCQILLRDRCSSRLRGKLSLVDLAGSERGSDTKEHNRQRRTESSEINKSLLTLKECIRALDSGKGSGGNNHVPYRGSKLTLVLKDCFTSSLARTTMIATVSPGSSSADHTINTLRYADRVKEKKVGEMKHSPKNNCGRDRVSTSPTRKHEGEHSTQETGVDKEVRILNEEETLECIQDELRQNYSTDTYIERSDNLTELEEMELMVHDEEDNLVQLHMTMIQEHAELLTKEGIMIKSITANEVSDDDIDQYAARLEKILDQKTTMISMLQENIETVRSHQERKEDLLRKVGKLTDFSIQLKSGLNHAST